MDINQLESIVFQGLGTASVSWTGTPTGVFDEQKAIDVGTYIMQKIAEYGVEKESAGFDRGYDIGFEDGEYEGREEGYSSGYDDGHEAGYERAQEEMIGEN